MLAAFRVIRHVRSKRRCRACTTPATSQHVAHQGWGAMIHCYDEALDEYPREHGIYNDAADFRG